MEEGAYDQVMSGMNPIEPVSGVDMEIIDLDEEQIAKIAEE